MARQNNQNGSRILQKMGEIIVAILLLSTPLSTQAQAPTAPTGNPAAGQSKANLTTPEEMNRRLQELLRAAAPENANTSSLQDYRIGPNDLLTIMVFDAPELSQPVRVSAGGQISLTLLGVVAAEGLTPRELELVLQELLRRNYMKDPHVTVQVTEMESHAVSVMGAVNKPGVVQIRGSKTLLEVLALAGGLAPDAGGSVYVMRNPKASSSAAGQPGMQKEEEAAQAEVPAEANFLEIDLKKLLESDDPRYNVLIHPGDTVKVKQAGMVYVVGEVKKSGGFALKSNERLTVLQAVALGEGLTGVASKGESLIIRTDENGQRTKIPIDLGRMLKGKTQDIALQAQDIVFVPSSGGKVFGKASADALFRLLSFRAVAF